MGILLQPLLVSADYCQKKQAEMSWLRLIIKCQGSNVCRDKKQLNVLNNQMEETVLWKSKVMGPAEKIWEKDKGD